MTLASWRYPRTSSPASQDLRRRPFGEPGKRTFRIHVDSASSSASLWIEKEQLFQLALCHPADDGGHTGEPNGTPQSAHGSGGTRPHEPGFQGCEAGAGGTCPVVGSSLSKPTTIPTKMKQRSGYGPTGSSSRSSLKALSGCAHPGGLSALCAAGRSTQTATGAPASTATSR